MPRRFSQAVSDKLSKKEEAKGARSRAKAIKMQCVELITHFIVVFNVLLPLGPLTLTGPSRI